VTAADRDLVAAMRAELAAIDPVRACDRQAERIGLGPVTGRGRDPVIGRLAVRLTRGPGGGAASFAGADMAETFDWETRAEHCRLAWLRGRFLSHGSMSIANSRTHLEFTVDPEEAPLLAARLASIGMPASWRLRRGRGVVTWKSAETVGLFLRRIGAGPSLLELEARQVSRTLRGELNRIINAESANLGRTVAAAGRQLAAIDALEADGRLGREPAMVRSVAAARRETPEATITDLADRLGVHRSAVQRSLERVERLALHGQPGEGESGISPLA
jgi:DNA-binding transcriptional regulator WhiA